LRQLFLKKIDFGLVEESVIKIRSERPVSPLWQ